MLGQTHQGDSRQGRESFHAQQWNELILANFSAAAIFLWFVSFDRSKEMN